MTDEKREALSALVDDELSGRDLDRLIDTLAADQELRATLSRYRLIGTVLRGEGGVPVSPRLSEELTVRLRDEPVILAPVRSGSRPPWGRAAAGLAIAASVAMLAIGLLPNQEVPLEPGATGSVASRTMPLEAPLTQLADSPAAGASAGAQGNASARTDGALSRYLAEHNEFASRGGASSFISYTTFVTYDGR